MPLFVLESLEFRDYVLCQLFLESLLVILEKVGLFDFIKPPFLLLIIIFSVLLVLFWASTPRGNLIVGVRVVPAVVA